MMGIFDSHQGSKPAPQHAMPALDEATAHAINFSGEGPYSKSFDQGYGVVFEDDGETGYFYATIQQQSVILDALLVYNRTDTDALQPGEEAFIVWNPARMRAGLFYHNCFQAVFDFTVCRGVCRSGFPPAPSTGWSPLGHIWDDALIVGIEP